MFNTSVFQSLSGIKKITTIDFIPPTISFFGGGFLLSFSNFIQMKISDLAFQHLFFSTDFVLTQNLRDCYIFNTFPPLADPVA